MLAEAITDPRALVDILGLNPTLADAARLHSRNFRLLVPRGYVARMRYGDSGDPLLRQVLPLADEAVQNPAFGVDPVGDRDARAAPGLLHKYAGRALLVTTGACAIHCRFCFRRHFPYETAAPSRETWQDALEYIGRDTSIHEVILSGGDPLTLLDDRLGALLVAIDAIPHIKRLRIHTRLPIVLPERVDEGLLACFKGLRSTPIVVIHANHAREIDDEVRRALGSLDATGVRLLNQSVLLRGVNDSAKALAELSETLFDAGVQPYYLHLLDRVRGATHFEVDEKHARAVLNELNARLPGYLVPRAVREIAGAPGKVPFF